MLWGMTPLVKYLPHKYEALSSDTQQPGAKPDLTANVCRSVEITGQPSQPDL